MRPFAFALCGVLAGCFTGPTETPVVCSGVIVADGNSLTDTAMNHPDWFSVVRDSLARPAIAWENVAVTKRTTGQLIALAPIEVDPLVTVEGNVHLVVLWEGSNDMSYGTSADSAEQNVVQYAADRRAAGWRVIVANVLPRVPAHITSADFEARRQTFNAWLRANWHTFADGFVDLGADAVIGRAGDNTNAQYYQADQVHLTTLGTMRVAQAMRPVIAGAIQAACH